MCFSREERLPSGQKVGPCRSSYEACRRNARRGDSYLLMILHNAERPTPPQPQHPAWHSGSRRPIRGAANSGDPMSVLCQGGEFTHSQD